MSEVALKVTKRGTGKKSSKVLRNEGKIPGVYYKLGSDGTPILSNKLDLRNIVYTPQTKIVNLEIEGVEGIHPSVLKDIDFDPITEEITHFDLLGLDDNHKVAVRIPFKFVGLAKGVVQGGVFRPVLSFVTISCYPKEIPDFIEVDISHLDIGQYLYLDALRTDKYEFTTKQNTVVCSISRPRVRGKE